jgi:DNA-binding response OmpR family regulator
MDESAAEARESVGCVVIAGGDPNSLALTKAIVQSQSIECQIATDGRCALEAIRRSHPGAVALDVDLPGLSAYEVLRMLRAENPGVKVLLLSSSAPPPVQADAYLTKPYNPIDLVVRLKRML